MTTFVIETVPHERLTEDDVARLRETVRSHCFVIRTRAAAAAVLRYVSNIGTRARVPMRCLRTPPQGFSLERDKFRYCHPDGTF